MKDNLAQFGHLVVQFQSALLQQLVDEFGVVNHVQFQTVLTIVVFKGGEAVGTKGDDLGHAFVGKLLDVFLCHLVKDILVAEPSQAVAAAVLFLAQDPPGNAGGVEDGGQGHGNMLGP